GDAFRADAGVEIAVSKPTTDDEVAADDDVIDRRRPGRPGAPDCPRPGKRWRHHVVFLCEEPRVDPPHPVDERTARQSIRWRRPDRLPRPVLDCEVNGLEALFGKEVDRRRPVLRVPRVDAKKSHSVPLAIFDRGAMRRCVLLSMAPFFFRSEGNFKAEADCR